MKKFIAAAAAVAMVFAMSVSAFAAVSPSVEVDEETAAKGITVEASTTKTVDMAKEEVANYTKDAEMTTLLQNANVDTTKEITYVAHFELEGVDPNGETVTLVVGKLNIGEGQGLFAIHEMANGQVEVVAMQYDATTGKASGLFTGASPVTLVIANEVALLEEPVVTTPTDESKTENKKDENAGKTSSYKTGDLGAVAVIVNALA